MRTITNVIIGLALPLLAMSVQAQKSEAQAVRPSSPAALIGLPSAMVTTESTELVATKIVLDGYTLPSPDPNLNDTFFIKMKLTVSESGDVEAAKVLKSARDKGADELYASAVEAIRQWKFDPRTKKGSAKKFSTVIVLKFVPSDRVPQNNQEHNPTGMPGQLIEVPELEAMSALTRFALPTYPKEASDMRLQGTVVVAVKIGKTGEVVDIKLVSGPGQIAIPAVDAVRQWRFEPFKRNGEPIDALVKIPIYFFLP